MTECPRPSERIATYVDDYLSKHQGLTLGELAFSIKADKRDLQRLVRDRSCGFRMMDALAAYFGDDFIETVFRPVVGDGPSIRERELELEGMGITKSVNRLSNLESKVADLLGWREEERVRHANKELRAKAIYGYPAPDISDEFRPWPPRG